MCKYKLFEGITCLLACAIVVTADSNETSQETRCFQFTWLGPRYTNESVFLNATCQDATRLAGGVPCFQPLVASYDGTWPDVEYILTHHSQQATCILANTDVCATYTYYFNGNPENSTYMCTRAVDTRGTAISNGCYQQTNGTFSVKACFCRSVPGGVPCNDAPISTVVSFSTFALIIALLINKNLMPIYFN